MKIPVTIRMISKSQVEELVSVEDVIDAVEGTFRELGNGTIFHPIHEPIWMEEDRANMILAMPAYVTSSRLVGAKWVNMFSRQQPGLPASHGNLLVLSSAENGLPYAIIEASAITAMRTAGGHGVVSAKYLAKKDSSVLAVIGCGEEAKSGIKGYLHMFPGIQTLNVFDIRPQAMKEMQELFGERLEIVCCDSAESAVRPADIVLLVTTATKPIVMFDWLKKGSFVSGMYSFNDLDPECSRKADKWYLGGREIDTHNIINSPPMRKNHLSAENVFGDMGEVVTGKCPGRENDQEIIVYTHMGMGALDVVVGDIIYKRAVDRNIGTIIDMG